MSATVHGSDPDAWGKLVEWERAHQGTPFAELLAAIERDARHVHKGGGPIDGGLAKHWDAELAVHFASVILQHVPSLRDAVERGDAKAAAEYALMLGRLHKDLEFTLHERAAATGYASRRGHEKRQDAIDKAEVRDLAKGHWRKHPDDTIAAVLRTSGIAPFTRKYTPKTVRGWIKDLKPGGTHPGRSGSPKKK